MLMPAKSMAPARRPRMGCASLMSRSLGHLGSWVVPRMAQFSCSSSSGITCAALVSISEASEKGSLGHAPQPRV